MIPNILEYQTFNKFGKKMGILRGAICEFREKVVRLANKRMIQLVDFMPADSKTSVTTYIEVSTINKEVTSNG